MPASADTGLACAPGWLETLRDFLRLREVFGRGMPEEQTTGDASHSDRGVELGGDAEDTVFHRGGACPLRKREARRPVVQGLNFFLKGVIKLRVHPGAAAHGAGFVKRDVFKVDSWRFLGHAGSLFSIHRGVQRPCADAIRGVWYCFSS
jgi:hypothetical protein